MATVPKATTVVKDTAGVPAGGLDVCCVMSPVGTSADITPRFFGTAQAIYDQHGYSEGLEYCALHLSQTRKPVLFIGLPIVTQGVLSRRNSDGNTGTAGVTVTPGASGPLAEHDGVVEVLAGGTVGSNQIVLGLSLDGGFTFQKLRVGLGNSVAIPYIGVTIGLLPGVLNAGDVVLSWHGTAPLSNTAGQELARQALAGQQKSFRSIMLIGDLPSHLEAANFLATLNSYETSNERFVYGRASIADRLPLAYTGSVKHLAVNAGAVTFAAAGHTITRTSGSFLTDGFIVGDLVSVAGSTSNNGAVGIATAVTATVLTFAAGVVNETTSAATVSSRVSLVFASAGNTITRGAGSWIAEGFAVGQSVTIAGTASNNQTAAVLTAVTATVLTFASGVVNETIGMGVGTITQVLTKAAWMAAQDVEFAPIDGPTAFRIDLSAGRGRITSPFSQWYFRRPWSWAASIREYQHDLHIATWRKQDGPIGFDLFDASGNLAEWDDRVDGGAGSAARFTTGRTWANGPVGSFVTQSLTRGSDGSLLSKTHNVAVVNLICTIVQLNTEDAAIGVSLVLNDDGTATTDSLSTIQKRVNDALELGVLVNALGEGQRASKAVWTPDPSVVFNVPEPVMLGTVDTNLNGTVHDVNTGVRLRTAGQ